LKRICITASFNILLGLKNVDLTTVYEKRGFGPDVQENIDEQLIWGV
jgi:hypothetical protein